MKSVRILQNQEKKAHGIFINLLQMQRCKKYSKMEIIVQNRRINKKQRKQKIIPKIIPNRNRVKSRKHTRNIRIEK